MTTRITTCTLEVDEDRGVVYVHNTSGVTVVRIQNIPKLLILPTAPMLDIRYTEPPDDD